MSQSLHVECDIIIIVVVESCKGLKFVNMMKNNQLSNKSFRKNHDNKS